MIKIAATKKNIIAIPIDSEFDFFKLNIKKVNKIFIKFAIHHFQHKKQFFSNLYEYFDGNSKGLIITRPKKSPYPFFKLADNSWLEIQDSAEIYIKDLQDCGFKNVKAEEISYPTKMKTSMSSSGTFSN